MVPREFCELFKSTYFMERLPVTPSDILKLKGTLMQIWKSAHIFVFIWKQYAEEFTFWDMHTWDMWKVSLQAFRTIWIC